MNYVKTCLTVALGIILMASLCRKEVPPERQWERGFFEPIGGKPFSLAAGLTIRTMYGSDSLSRVSELPLDMLIRNGTARRITTTFPAGLVLSPYDPEYAYMILLQDFRFSVPADAETVILLPTYSCNEDQYEPDDESIYRTDIRVFERELNELLDLLVGKKLEGDTAVPLAQEALWEITEYEGLTDSMRTLLEDLP